MCEVIPEAASGKGKHSQLFQVVLLAASRHFQKLRNRKMGSQTTDVGSVFRVLFWYHKLGDNEMQQTVGLHFVVPQFVVPNRYPKNGTIFFLKKKTFFLAPFLKENVFFQTETLCKVPCGGEIR